MAELVSTIDFYKLVFQEDLEAFLTEVLGRPTYIDVEYREVIIEICALVDGSDAYFRQYIEDYYPDTESIFIEQHMVPAAIRAMCCQGHIKPANYLVILETSNHG